MASKQSPVVGTQQTIRGTEGAPVCNLSPGQHVMWVGTAILIKPGEAGGITQARAIKHLSWNGSDEAARTSLVTYAMETSIKDGWFLGSLEVEAVIVNTEAPAAADVKPQHSGLPSGANSTDLIGGTGAVMTSPMA